MGRIKNAISALRGDLSPLPEVERATSPPPIFAAQENRFGLSERISKDSLLRQVQGWQAIAINAIANEVMALNPIVVVKRMGANGVVQEELLDDHPLKELLDKPSANFTRRMLFRLLGQWIPQVGDSYLLKITDSMGVPRELEPLNPKDVELIAGRSGIEGYLYRSPYSGKEVEYSADEVIRIYEPDPECPFLGLGNLSPQALAYDASLFLDQTIRKHFQEDATPPVVIKYDKDAQLPSPENQKRFLQEWKDFYNRRKGSRAGIPAVLHGAEIQELTFWTGKELVPVLEHFRDKILSANGVPGSIVGLVQDVNRAAAETNQFIFENTTIKPIAELIADALTIQLARDFDPNLVIKFEDFITVDKGFELEKRKTMLEQKVVSINEVRRDDGLEPASWGEFPAGSQQDVPFTGAAPTPEDPPEPDSPNQRDADRGE